jgi:pSer/pThr/pTyr-binding forkhead associated (FHA) protein
MVDKPSILVTFVHIEGPLKGEIQELREDEIFIGRHPSCHVLFPKDFRIISRNHAQIIREGNRFKLLDQSSNGTFVNGERVKGTYLVSGDVLVFAEGGPKVSFLTTIEEGSPPAEHAAKAGKRRSGKSLLLPNRPHPGQLPLHHRHLHQERPKCLL